MFDARGTCNTMLKASLKSANYIHISPDVHDEFYSSIHLIFFLKLWFSFPGDRFAIIQLSGRDNPSKMFKNFHCITSLNSTLSSFQEKHKKRQISLNANTFYSIKFNPFDSILTLLTKPEP